MITGDTLRTMARDESIHAIGWFAATDFSAYLETIESSPAYHVIKYRPVEAFRAAGHIPSDIRTVVVLVMDYYVESSEGRDGYRLSNYARACWTTVPPKTQRVVEWLRAQGCLARAVDLPMRAAACRAGLGFIGRNTVFYAHGLGSYVGIAAIGTDAMIDGASIMPERVVHPRCETCRACIKACPVGAIADEGYRIDPRRCLSFINRHAEEPHGVMPDEPGRLQDWLFGCESCQNVCPINAAAMHRHEVIVPPTICVEGMTLPNTATISRETLENSKSAIRSPHYHAYIERLLAQPASSRSHLA